MTILGMDISTGVTGFFLWEVDKALPAHGPATTRFNARFPLPDMRIDVDEYDEEVRHEDNTTTITVGEATLRIVEVGYKLRKPDMPAEAEGEDVGAMSDEEWEESARAADANTAGAEE